MPVPRARSRHGVARGSVSRPGRHPGEPRCNRRQPARARSASPITDIPRRPVAKSSPNPPTGGASRRTRRPCQRPRVGTRVSSPRPQSAAEQLAASKGFGGPIGGDAAVAVARLYAHIGADMPRHLRRLSLHRRDLPCELVGEPGVVRIEKRHELAARRRDPRIARRGGAAVLRVHDTMQPRVDELGERGSEPIRRRVVDHDDFEIRVALAEDRGDRALDQQRAVVNRDNNASD